MKTLNHSCTPRETDRPALFPNDLSEWHSPSTLAQWCIDAARAIYWTSSKDDKSLPSRDRTWPLRQLALFTYSYASGAFAIRDVEVQLVSDSALVDLGARAYSTSERLRLFRSHHSELIKLCLARVLARAWTSKFEEPVFRGNAECSRRYEITQRDLFLTEAARRVRLACRVDVNRCDAPAKRTPTATPSENVVHKVTPMRWINWRSIRAAVCAWVASVIVLTCVHAEEKFPLLTIDDKSYTNAVVIESNPVDIVIKAEGLTLKRIKRQDLPEALRDRYPYDAAQAEQYEKEKLVRTKGQQEHQRSEAQVALLRREAWLQAKIRSVDTRLNALQKELDVLNVSAKGKPKSAARQEADRFRTTKQHLIRYQEQLRDQLEQVRNALSQWR